VRVAVIPEMVWLRWELLLPKTVRRYISDWGNARVL